jgi:hypothetical protein
MQDDDRQHELGDDRVIGVAFRRSVAVVMMGVIIGLVTTWILRARPIEERVVAKSIAAPRELDRSGAGRPALPFTDITTRSGIEFVHVNGATGDKLLPETMGSGVAVLDFDSDGDQDLLFVSSTKWPWAPAGAPAGHPRLYANDGRAHFTDVTRPMGLELELYGMGVAVGDLDGDGDPEVLLTAVGPNRLLRNDGDRFVDVTASAGVAGDSAGWSTSAAVFDADGDGDLDLLVADYIRWSRELDFEVNYTLNGSDRAYGPPTSYEGTTLHLFRNDGGLQFTDISEAAGVRVLNPATGAPMAKALALGVVDIDGDGALDVFVANDTVQNFLLRNRGDGTFEEVGAGTGVAFDSAGVSTGAMGVDAADVTGQGGMAIAVGNFANEMTSFYVSGRVPWLFVDRAGAEGLGSPSRQRLTFGLFFFDADLDGRLDLLQANGHLEENIAQVQASQTWRQSAQLFWNAGPEATSLFVEIPPSDLGDLSRPIVGRGAAYADLDGDGDLDVVLTANGDRPLVLRNDQATGHHWLRIRLQGDRPNVDAIGAVAALDVGGGHLRRTVMPTRGYLSQVESVLTFGLGGVATAGPVTVRWSDGSRERFDISGVDREIVVRQGDGAPADS